MTNVKVSLSTSGGTTNLTGTVIVTASPVPESAVTRVEFYVDGMLKSTETALPFAYSWDTYSPGGERHQLKARVFYSRRKVAEAKLEVTVMTIPTPPLGPPSSPVQAEPVLIEA